MNNTEIERKFLVKSDFRPFVQRSLQLAQGYLCTEPGRTVRVRISDDKGYLTIKGPAASGRLARFEWEREIPLEDARQLLRLCPPEEVLSKTRHLIPSEDGLHTWEVDEFHGDNEGLVVAEIELRSEDDTFPRPEWLGEEVTGDRRYCNSLLSRYPYRIWNKDKTQI